MVSCRQFRLILKGVEKRAKAGFAATNMTLPVQEYKPLSKSRPEGAG